MNCVARSALVLLVLCCCTISGCATIVKGSTQPLTVQTEPDGANCELTREGQTIGAINPTPGTVQIDKTKSDIEITCKKKGFSNAVVTVSSTFQSWTVGNILIGGLIGIAIDASSGAINEYPSSVELKLIPDKFTNAEDQEDFYDKWRMEVLRNSAKVKIAASKTCVKEQCDEVSKRIDKETELALAGIDANRNLRSNQGSPASPGNVSAPQMAAAPAATSQVTNPGQVGSLKSGDRWTYRLSDNARPVGKVVIEAAGVRGAQVLERITREDQKSFYAERNVDAGFNPIRFQEIVTLPGGFQLAEIAPYAPPDTEFQPGKKWQNIPGKFLMPHFGKQQILAEARVVGKESVRVPAGSFEATRIEVTGKVDSGWGTARITCNYWYSPQHMRTVKMNLEIVYSINVPKSMETYELVSFEPAH